MAPNLDNSELHIDKYQTSSTKTTEDKDTEDTNGSNTPRADKPHKRPKLQAIKTTNIDYVIPTSFETTTVKEMMKPDPIQMRCVVYLHLLKILTKQQTANTVYNIGVKQKQKQSDIGPQRLLLFMDIMDLQGLTVYIISTGKSRNKNLWSKARSCCDDGSISIGTIVAIL